MQRVPNGDSELQQKAFGLDFGGKNIKGEERFLLEKKKIILGTL